MDKRTISVKVKLINLLHDILLNIADEISKVNTIQETNETMFLCENLAHKLIEQDLTLLHFEFAYKKAKIYFEESKEYLDSNTVSGLEKGWKKFEEAAIKEYPETFGDSERILIVYGLEIPQYVSDAEALKVAEDNDLEYVKAHCQGRYVCTIIKKGKIEYGWDWSQIYEFAKKIGEGVWEAEKIKKITECMNTDIKPAHFFLTRDM